MSYVYRDGFGTSSEDNLLVREDLEQSESEAQTAWKLRLTDRGQLLQENKLMKPAPQGRLKTLLKIGTLGGKITPKKSLMPLYLPTKPIGGRKDIITPDLSRLRRRPVLRAFNGGGRSFNG